MMVILTDSIRPGLGSRSWRLQQSGRIALARGIETAYLPLTQFPFAAGLLVGWCGKSRYWRGRMSFGLILLVIVVVVVLAAIWIYNNLVALRQRTNQAFADVDVQMKQRHDLIPNLVETVKGYAGHERGTLEAVVAARNAAVQAQGQGPAQQAQAENMLSGALRQMFALSEAYPDLKASANFQQLQASLSDIENKLAASRRFFNNAVSEYNASIQAFPAVVFASMFGFAQREFFDVGTETRAALDQAPQVKF